MSPSCPPGLPGSVVNPLRLDPESVMRHDADRVRCELSDSSLCHRRYEGDDRYRRYEGDDRCPVPDPYNTYIQRGSLPPPVPDTEERTRFLVPFR